MDYHKDYLKFYEEYLKRYEELAIKEIIKGKKMGLSFLTTRDAINALFRDIRHKVNSDLKNLNLNQALEKFYEYTTFYNPICALEKTINDQLFNFYEEYKNNKCTSYPDFLNLLAKYYVADYITTQIYNTNIFNEEILYDSDLNKYTLKIKLDPINNLRAYQDNLRQKYNLSLNQDLSIESTLAVIQWKERISKFNHEEKIILISTYIKVQKDVQRPELLKLIMITGGIFDLSVLNGNYTNEKFYKIILEGIDYFEANQSDILSDIIAKLIPFKMERISKALKRKLATMNNGSKLQ